jgi:hypothetical protein
LKNVSILLLLLLLGLCLFSCSQSEGSLEIRILDAGEATPARVEILDAAQKPWVPSDALAITMECFESPPPDWLQANVLTQEIDNPYTATKQFYTAGHTSLELPPGSYRVRVYKGNEFKVSTSKIEITPGQHERLEVALERWVDPAREGWYGSDDHLHISRYRADLNPNILAWMRAEGLSVANLLQMGTADQFTVTPQFAFGDAGVYRGDEAALLAGQEHPRTHFLGHTITLGAREFIDLRDTYIVYEEFWKQSEKLGGVSGFAHLGQGPAHDGLAISAPGQRISFIEVLQAEFLRVRVWYELLNLGFRIAPSAGTDFPCIPSTPGRERVYVHTEGPLTRASYVEGMRRGRTFVTNGSVLQLTADGQGIGGEVRMPRPGKVSVLGAVRFDADREDIHTVEVVLGGVPVPSQTRTIAPGHIEVVTEVEVSRSTWVALRVLGSKLDEALYRVLEPPPSWTHIIASGWSFEGIEEQSRLSQRPSAAHTGAIYIDVAGTPRQDVSELAREWIARLDDIEARLADERIAEIPIADWFPYSDGVSEAHLRRHRPTLLSAIQSARAHYQSLVETKRVSGQTR